MLEISGDSKEALKSALEFVIKYDDKDIDSIRGIREVDGGLCFYSIPLVDWSKPERGYYMRAEDKYDIKFYSTLIPVNTELLASIILKWLGTEDVKEGYKDLWYDGDGVSVKGWKLSTDDKALFKVKPYVSYYAK